MPSSRRGHRALRADRGRQDRGGARAGRRAARARRGPGGDLRRRAPGLPRARDPDRSARPRPSASVSSTGSWAFVPVDRRRSRSASSCRSPTARSTPPSRPAGDRSWSGGTGLYLRAALTELDLRPPPAAGRARAPRGASRASAGAPALHAELAARAPEAAGRIEPGDRSRVVRALELLESGERSGAAAGGASELWTRRVAPPHAAGRPLMDRDALYAAHRRPGRRRWSPPAPRRRSGAPQAAGASPTARAALGFDELCARRRRGHEAPDAPPTPSASSPGCASSPARGSST